MDEEVGLVRQLESRQELPVGDAPDPVQEVRGLHLERRRTCPAGVDEEDFASRATPDTRGPVRVRPGCRGRPYGVLPRPSGPSSMTTETSRGVRS